MQPIKIVTVQNTELSKTDIAVLKRKKVEYCIDGYHSLHSVEHNGLLNLLLWSE